MHDNVVNVFFASQSGNAEDLAYDFHDRLTGLQLACHVEDVRYAVPEEFKAMKVIVFFVSTTGYGEIPDSMASCWKYLLRKSLNATTLSQTSFAVFGLGDSSYEHFNVVARKFYVRLSQLGATPFTDLGLGDDQAPFAYFSAYNPWERAVIDKLLAMVPRIAMNINDDIIQISNESSCSELIQSHHDACELLSFEYVNRGSVVENRRITEQNWFQDVRQLTVQPTSNSCTYDAGDVIVLHYSNPEDSVQRALKLLSIDGNASQDIITVSTTSSLKRKSRIYKDCRISIENLLHYVLDINAVPKRSFFRVLAKYANHNEELKNKLLELSSPEGTDLFIDFCVRERRSYIEILEEFKMFNFPLQEWIRAIPIIQPRCYSVASAPVHNNMVSPWIQLK